MLAGKLLFAPIGADAVTLAASIPAERFAEHLAGIDNRYPLFNTPLPQEFTYGPSHAALVGIGNVGNMDLCRVKLGRRSHAGDNGDSPLQATDDQMDLAGKMVNTVHNIIVGTGKEKVAVFSCIEITIRDDFSLGVDETQPVGHNLHLGFADRAIHGMELPIHVGEADIVEIDDSQPADAGATEGLGSKAANSAQTENRHTGRLQTPQADTAYQKFGA